MSLFKCIEDIRNYLIDEKHCLLDRIEEFELEGNSELITRKLCYGRGRLDVINSLLTDIRHNKKHHECIKQHYCGICGNDFSEE